MRRIERENHGKMSPGQDLVVVGYPGLKGTLVLIQEQEELLSQWFMLSYFDEIRQLSTAFPDPTREWLTMVGATECEKIGEGGIYTALWNLSGGYEQGISFTLRDIPLRQETVEVCERFELNPYRLMSDDCLLLVSDNGGCTVRALRQQGIDASVIGYVNHSIKREIFHEEGLGYLERPQQDELWNVIQRPSEEGI